jgi:S1-C subfamily serine protease
MSAIRKAAHCLLMSAITMLGSAGFADDLADKGRDILEKNRHAVITVQVVLKMKMSFSGSVGEQSNESKEEITGTIIDSNGLTVVSLTSCEPADFMESFMGGESEDEAKVKMASELSDVKLLLEDGTELAAEVVLRDKDLDLAFIRPKSKPADSLPNIDLSKSTAAKVLDQVITLNRLGQVAGRAYAASVDRVSAVVQKPRQFYVAGGEGSLGSPVFAADGKILGVGVMRSIRQKSAGGGMFSLHPDGAMQIILPAAEILKVAKQAPDVKEKAQTENKADSDGSKPRDAGEKK